MTAGWSVGLGGIASRGFSGQKTGDQKADGRDQDGRREWKSEHASEEHEPEVARQTADTQLFQPG